MPVTAPKYLYKYRAFDHHRLWEMLVLHRFFFDEPGNFNDPFECLPTEVYEATEEERQRRELRRLIRDYQGFRGMHEEAAQRAREPFGPGTTEIINAFYAKARHDIAVFCLSARYDDILMWSHYANNHTGVCLQFNTDSRPLNEARAVYYNDSRFPLSKIVTENGADCRGELVLTKSDHWKYEQEWRIAYVDQKRGVHEFPPGALSGVILGARCSAQGELYIKTLLQGRLPEVRVAKAEISSRGSAGMV